MSSYGSSNLEIFLIVPPGIGFGGVGYAPGVSFLDFLGDSYGGGSYGTSILPGPPSPVVSGYGGDPYGSGPYGSLDVPVYGLPTVISAQSLDGFRVEVIFSHEMLVNNDFLNTSSYIFTSILGAAPVIIESVATSASFGGSSDRAILEVEGTTLGGIYSLDAINLIRALDGAVITTAFPVVTFLALGTAPDLLSIDSNIGNQIVLGFSKPMLPEADFSGIENTTGYLFSSSYPVNIDVISVLHPYLGNPNQVLLNVEGQTSTNYSLLVGPATAIDYTPDILPNQSQTFLGSAVGTGVSELVGSYLSLSKSSLSTYGWSFIDITGKIQPNSTYRVDLDFIANLGTYSPSLSNSILAALFVSDLQTQVSIIFEYVAGQPYLTLDSGTYTNSVQADWFSTPNTKVSLVRNQRASTHTLLLNDIPLITVLSSWLDGVVTLPRGCQFILTSGQSVDGFLFGRLTFNCTQTIFSQAWNFLHNNQQEYVGFADPNFTSKTFLTSNGPLVKMWGDDTPATKNDVRVFLNNTEIVVSNVNPYYGEIELEIPIPFTTPGTNNVEVDYYWMKNPVLEFPGYNVRGAVLNKADQSGNITYEDQYFSRFRYTLVFPNRARQQPPRYAYRFLAFERAYSAVMNDPTTLLLNQDSHAIAVPDFEGYPKAITDNFEGTYFPAIDGWLLSGNISESIEDNELYVLDKNISGNYDTGSFGFFSKSIEVSLPVVSTIAARLSISSYDFTGVFSGVGIGIHNNSRFFIVGAIQINGLFHIGMLKNFLDPTISTSWEVGISESVEIISSNTYLTNTTVIPQGLGVGHRLQILEGSQQGVYTISDLVYLDNGDVEISIDGTFPANYELWGNNKATIYYEFRWDNGEPFTLRLIVDFDECFAESYIYGSLTRKVARIEKLYDDAQPSHALFNFNLTEEGQIFWGHLTRDAVSVTKWSFFRWSVTPTYNVHVPVISYDMDMSSIPDLINCGDWFTTQDFGSASLYNSDELSIKSPYRSTNTDLSFGYTRIEPMFRVGHHVDLEFVIRELYSSQSFDGTIVRISDGIKVVHFSTLSYIEDGTRKLFTRPSASLYGFSDPILQSWVMSNDFTLSTKSSYRLLNLSSDIDQYGMYGYIISGINGVYPDTGSRDLEFKLRINNFTGNNVGILFGCSVAIYNNLLPRDLSIAWEIISGVKSISIYSDNTFILSFPYAWDLEFHVYTIKHDGISQSANIIIDDIVVYTGIPYSSLIPISGSIANTVYFGKPSPGTISNIDLEYLYCLCSLPNNLYNTVGIWTGGNLNDINSWRLPRTDGTGAVNSSLSANIVQMNHVSPITIKLHLDADWGVTLLRPDIPLPLTATTTFATQITNVSNSWLHLEYAELPVDIKSFGSIQFGCLSPTNISSSLWDRLSYRIYNHYNNDYRSSPNMVLNQVNSVHSGEYGLDVTPEDVRIKSKDLTTIDLKYSNITGELIYRVYDEDASYLHPVSSWSFDKDTQIIKLHTGEFSSKNANVRVIFLPTLPITVSYLDSQPFNQSGIILNEGVPPFYRSMLSSGEPEIRTGAVMNDDYSLMNDSSLVLNDSYDYIYYNPDTQAPLHCLEESILTEEGQEDLLSSICDELLSIEFSGGDLFYDSIDLGWSNIGTLSSLKTFGGGYAQANTYYNESLFWTNYSPNQQVVNGTIGGVNNQITIVIDINTVVIDANLGTEQALVDEISISEQFDNLPPSEHGDSLNAPNGPAGANLRGACLVTIVETTLLYSVYGPHLGYPSLTPYSLFYGVNPNQLSGIPLSGQGLTYAGGAPLTNNIVTNTFYLEST